MNTAIRKAKNAGFAYVGVTGSSHFAAAGYYATMALKEDMIGLSMTNADPVMTAPGAKGRIIGTNPIAYAVPAGTGRPIFLDIAMSTVAATKVLAAKDSGKKIPDTWLVDNEGLPTTDPSIFPAMGAVLPMSGHKGYGLALFVEVLTAVLTGAGMTQQVPSWRGDVPGPTNCGHAFIAINVGAIMPIQDFKARMDRMIREIKASPKVKGTERIYLPGEMEWERRDEALEKGMQLPEHVVASLMGLAEDMGLEKELHGLFKGV
jgi:LDH2 family malate/lactate/ureidoglycolate dehydrogenase